MKLPMTASAPSTPTDQRTPEHVDPEAPAFVDGKATPAAAKIFAEIADMVTPHIQSAADPQAAYDEIMTVWNRLLHEAALTAENAAYLPDLTAECERHDLALQITDDPADDLPEVKLINGRLTCIARADELGVALDEVRLTYRAAADSGREHTEPLLSTEQTTLVMDEGLGGWRTAPVESEMRDIDDQRLPAENAETPFLAAEIVMIDWRSQAYGRKTEVWLRYGLTTGSLTPAEAREALAEIKSFVPYLEAVVERAEEIGAGDFEGDPEVARLDREAEDRRIRAIDEARAAKAGK
jgi:hypothetical protein